MAASSSTGVFSCAFTRRNCAHEAVFHAEYQRTNRTKENKILRCFPHCCPDHVTRSYCGSSLHLQVDFHGGASSSSSTSSATSAWGSAAPLPPPPSRLCFPQPRRDDDLMVFGRFRPKDTRGLSIGDAVAGEAILSSLQSEDNPAGEWIEAWLIASADRNAWLFEVNHAARWYYNWGSSAAKDKRLKEHVFEVYVLFQPSAAPSESFQVVATSCSPPFKLLSFRRASAESRLRGHDATTNTKTEEVEIETNPPPVHRLPAPPPPRESERRQWSEWEEKESRPEEHVSAVARRATSLSPSSSSQDYYPRSVASTQHAFTQHAFGRLALPAVALEQAQRHSASYFDSRGRVPTPPHKRARTAMGATPPPSQSALSSFSSSRFEPHETRTASSTATAHSRPPSRSLSRLDELLLISGFLQRLPLSTALLLVPSLHAAFQQHAAHTVALWRPPRDPQSSSSSATARRVEKLLLELCDARPLPYLSPSLVDAACHLSLWLAFDPAVRQSLTSLCEQAAAVLLDKEALAKVHARLIRWLHAQIERELQTKQWSVDAFVAAVERSGLVATNSTSNRNSNYHGTGVAMEDLVAQAREHFIDSHPTSDYRDAGLAAFASRRSSSLLDGTWRSDLNGIHVRSCADRDRDSSSSGSSHSLSPVPLQALLWFWRQLSCVSVRLRPTCSEGATLEIQSAFASRDTRRAMRLVLDGRTRWFRSFPGGESTSAVAVGSQRFGDYHAVHTPHSDGVECVLYSWPVDGASASSSDAVACRWRWSLQPLSAVGQSSQTLLRVQLVLETARVASGQEKLLETASLQLKTARVGQWQRALVADWVSERTETSVSHRTEGS